MNLLNLPDWSVERVEDSARDYRVEPPGALGTDIDALLAVLEREQHESQKSTR